MSKKSTPIPKHRIQLNKTIKGCEILEKTPRYDVMLNGIKVDQLWFNMRGYVGNLPLPDGKKLGMPETSISEYRKTIARINRGEIQ